MNLRGFIDIHVHTAPSIFPRSVTDRELAEHARAAGMRGFVLKAHEECTVSRAELLREQFPELDIFGSIVLNWFVGGLNPYAVDLAIQRRAKIVWMPTVSAKQHLNYYGGPDYTAQRSSVRLLPQKPITILDERGRPFPELYEILDLIAEADVVVASGHLSPQETQLLVDVAIQRGVQKILVAHPDLGLNRMPLELQVELTRKGAYVEKSYLTLTPKWESIELDELVASIRMIGPERCVLQTDFGQADHPSPPQAYGEFLTMLKTAGIPEDWLFKMGAENPAELLGIAKPHRTGEALEGE